MRNFIFLILSIFLVFSKYSYAEYKSYVGIQGGFIYSDNEGSADKNAQDLANASGATVNYAYEETTWGLRPYGGFIVNDKVALEVGYVLSGSIDETYKGSSSGTAWTYTQGASVDGVDGAVKFNFDNLFAKIGIHQLTIEAVGAFTASGFTYSGGASRSGSGFLLGGGYQDELGDDLYWNAQFTYYDSVGGVADATMSLFAVGIEKRF
jgi:hypothetical protein